MKKFALSLFAGAMIVVAPLSAMASEAECKKLKNEQEVIYAAKGFCFGEKDAKEKFNKDCFTSKPKFSDKEKEKLDAIKQRQKELNCK